MRLRMTVAFLAVLLVAGCRVTAGDNSALTNANRERFSRDRQKLEAAASYTLDHARVRAGTYASVELPPRFRALADDGVAQYFVSGGNAYVFFAVGPSGPRTWAGFVYSETGTPLPAKLGTYSVGPSEPLDGNWFGVTLRGGVSTVTTDTSGM